MTRTKGRRRKERNEAKKREEREGNNRVARQ